MPEYSEFERLCHRLRFPLDTPGEHHSEDSHYLPEFVARVRSSGLQVMPTTVPGVAQAVSAVAKGLHVAREPEVYIVADSEPNAFVPPLSSDRRPIVVLNSGLVSLLSLNELMFAVAHELAHLGLRHTFREPVPRPTSEFQALQIRSIQRYAEISADRVALTCTRSVFVAARVMLQLASGLPSEHLGLDIDAFIRQIDREPGEISREWELALSHPSMPFRLWALLRFSHSDVYAESTHQGGDGAPIGEIDQQISSRLAEMGDGRLTEMEANLYQVSLVWAGTAMVMDDDIIEDTEITALERLVGEELAEKAITFARSNGRDAVLTKLADSLSKASATSLATRRRLDQAVQAFAMSLDLDLRSTGAGRVFQECLSLR